MNQSNNQTHGNALLETQIKRPGALRLSELCSSGYWLCQDCDGINTREEDDHGQPASCSSCGSHRVRLQPAALPALIEPGDLHD